MSQWTQSRKFRNASGTVSISVCAKVESHPFVPAKVDAKIVEILATGGLVPRNDDERDEAARLFRYVHAQYVGKLHSTFLNAREIVMGHNITVEKKQPEIRIVNTISLPFGGFATPEGRRKYEQTLLESIRKNITNPEVQIKNVGHKNFASAPSPGTYWQDRIRPTRFFVCVATSECEGHTHVRMVRTGRGGEYEWPFVDAVQWDKLFKQVSRAEAEPNSYSAMAEAYLGAEYAPARKVGMPPELGMPYSASRVELGARRDEAEQLIEDFRSTYPEIGDFFKRFIGAVEFTGNEQPPGVGERYHSYISNQTYTVLDVRRKRNHESDYDVTMERDGDGHRTKFTYRDHATWLSVWRPLDDDGKARTVVEVKVDASDALRQVGEAAHRAAEAARVFSHAHEDSAVYDLVRIIDELHKRLPGWNELPNTVGYAGYTETDKIILAIRTLTRQRNNASHDLQQMRRENEALKEKNKAQLAIAEVRNREVAALKKERGGSWGPERIRTEQDRMREMVYEFTRLFKYAYGVERVKVHMQAFGITSMAEMPLEIYLDFMRDCRAYAEKHVL